MMKTKTGIVSFKTDVPQRIQDMVLRWFDGDRSMPYVLSGDRSVYIDIGIGNQHLKIKGSGLRGGPIRYDIPRNTGPKAPVYDFEGAFMEDVAAGHDNAPNGGMSFQQAATEWQSYQILSSARPDMNIVPCLGWGNISDGNNESWFSVHLWPRNFLRDYEMTDFSPDKRADLNMVLATTCLDLMSKNELSGYFSAVLDGPTPIYFDLHPMRMCHPLNTSALTFAMHYIFNVMVMCNAINAVIDKTGIQSHHPDAKAKAFVPILPDVKLDDYKILARIMWGYIAVRNPSFSPRGLARALRSCRIGNAVLDHVPSKFVMPW